MVSIQDVLSQDEWEAHVTARLRACGFSKQDLSCTFANFDPDVGPNRKAWELCQRYAQEFRPGLGWGLMLHGPVGVGKSHLAAATVRDIVSAAERKGDSLAVRKWKLPELLARGRSMFDDVSAMSELVEELAGLDLVWLDEFTLDVVGSGGFERARAVETLYRIVDTLVEAHAGWLVTTNSSPDALYRSLRTLDPTDRIADRLRGALVPVPLGGESYRRVQRGQRIPDWVWEGA